jgi:hypothetical protein
MDRKPAKGRRGPSKRPARRNEVQYYVLEIADWDWSLSFGLDASLRPEGLYSDYRHLHLRGKLLQPSKLNVREAELIFLPRDLREDERATRPPTNVGSFRLYRGRLEGLITIPADALPLTLQTLIGERFRYAILAAQPLRYGRADILRYRLQRTVDEDDLPPEDSSTSSSDE